MNFNSHARVGRDNDVLIDQNYSADFNSHARVGRDFEHLVLFFYADVISTHTPAWGVTKAGKNEAEFLAISTHTPAWGVTVFGDLMWSRTI